MTSQVRACAIPLLSIIVLLGVDAAQGGDRLPRARISHAVGGSPLDLVGQDRSPGTAHPRDIYTIADYHGAVDALRLKK